MINLDINKVKLSELIEHLTDIENCHMRIIRTYDSTRLIFEPTANEAAHISNIEAICRWTAAHKHTVQIQSNGENNGIAVIISRLYPAEYYKENNILL